MPVTDVMNKMLLFHTQYLKTFLNGLTRILLSEISAAPIILENLGLTVCICTTTAPTLLSLHYMQKTVFVCILNTVYTTI